MFLWILPGIKSQFWFPFTFRLLLEQDAWFVQKNTHITAANVIFCAQIILKVTDTVVFSTDVLVYKLGKRKVIPGAFGH